VEQISLFIKSLLGYFKISYEVKMSLSIVTFIILILPLCLTVHFANNFSGILAIRSSYLPYIVIVFLISVVFTFAEWLKNRKLFRNIKYRLKNLSPDEKAILQKFIVSNTRSQKLDMNAGAVIALEQDNIIYRANIITTDYFDKMYFNFNIQVFAMNYLKKKPHLIGVKRQR